MDCVICLTFLFKALVLLSLCRNPVYILYAHFALFTSPDNKTMSNSQSVSHLHGLKCVLKGGVSHLQRGGQMYETLLTLFSSDCRVYT